MRVRPGWQAPARPPSLPGPGQHVPPQARPTGAPGACPLCGPVSTRPRRSLGWRPALALLQVGKGQQPAWVRAARPQMLPAGLRTLAQRAWTRRKAAILGSCQGVGAKEGIRAVRPRQEPPGSGGRAEFALRPRPARHSAGLRRNAWQTPPPPEPRPPHAQPRSSASLGSFWSRHGSSPRVTGACTRGDPAVWPEEARNFSF